MLQRLLASNPELKSHLFDGGRLRPDICILVNGRNIRYLTVRPTSLDDDDTITIFRQVAGGALAERRRIHPIAKVLIIGNGAAAISELGPCVS